ncbi:MAG: Phage Tail Collar Domain protein [Mucilaginibacter sp.]|nr:Phage Tail Collar Domain protein [Mucilaginibacter sp.]
MDAFVSTILLWPLNWAPRNFLNCQGQTLPISQNAALFSLLGTTYGGNGTSTFMLPDFRGRLPVGYNPGGAPGVSVNSVGQVAGSEHATILINNLPAHSHTATFTPSSGGSGSLKASANQATQSIPGTSGANTLGAGWDGLNADAINMYVADAAPAVSLVGLSVTGGGGTVQVGLTGNSLPLNIQSPYLVVNYIICIYGIFPSRN